MRCTYQFDATKHVTAFKERFLKGHYTTKEIGIWIQRGKGRYKRILQAAQQGLRPLHRPRSFRKHNQNKQLFAPPGPPTLWLPFCNFGLRRRIQRIIRSCNLDLQVKSLPGRSLRSILCTSARAPVRCENPNDCVVCNSAPSNSRRRGLAKCMDKDVVYAVECKHDGKKYYGETGRPLGIRIKEHLNHLRAQRNRASALAAHHHEAHPDFVPSLETTVLHRGGGYVLRRCLEALAVLEDQPQLNRHQEGSGIVKLY